MKKATLTLLLILESTACQFTETRRVGSSSTSGSNFTDSSTEALQARSVAIQFHYTDFFNLRTSSSGDESFIPPYDKTGPSFTDGLVTGDFSGPNQYGCAGDIKTYYWAEGENAGTAFDEDASSSDGESLKPGWIRHVSVDVSDSNTDSDTDPDNEAFSCSNRDPNGDAGNPPRSACGRFDFEPLFTSTSDTVLRSEDSSSNACIPSTGPSDPYHCYYYTGYYTTYDHECIDSGPIAIGGDPEASKLLAGGAYIFLERSELESDENLLLHLTYFPLGRSNAKYDVTSATRDSNGLAHFSKGEETYFRIHLMSTSITQASFASMPQPRYMNLTDTVAYPRTYQTLAILGPPSGGPVEEQIFLPITIDTSIDLIRIERYSGSAILIGAKLFRMSTP